MTGSGDRLPSPHHLSRIFVIPTAARDIEVAVP